MRWVVWVDDDFSRYVYATGFTSEVVAWQWISDNKLPGGTKMWPKEEGQCP